MCRPETTATALVQFWLITAKYNQVVAKRARFKEIAHNIAHHAQSGLSFIAPHLAHCCHTAGLSAVTLDLLAGRPFPQSFPVSRELASSAAALQVRFRPMVSTAGL